MFSLTDILAKFTAGCLTMLVISFLYMLVFGVIFMLVWDWIMPDLFGLSEITYLQSLGLMFLTRMLLPSINVNSGK